MSLLTVLGSARWSGRDRRNGPGGLETHRVLFATVAPPVWLPWETGKAAMRGRGTRLRKATMDATHQRIYDEWVTAGRPGNEHPRPLLELLKRERKANVEYKFKLGDVVRLKSGGPDMVVYELRAENEVMCRWFPAGSGSPNAGCFEVWSLKLVPQ